MKQQAAKQRAVLRPVLEGFRQLSIDNKELAHTARTTIEFTVDHLKTDLQRSAPPPPTTNTKLAAGFCRFPDFFRRFVGFLGHPNQKKGSEWCEMRMI